MPNIKSAKKRVKQSEKKHSRNIARKSAIKSAIKKVLVAVEENNIEQAKELLKDVEAKFARAKNKGVVHRNTAARKVSHLAKRVAAAQRAAA